jgi:hypothetical protein
MVGSIITHEEEAILYLNPNEKENLIRYGVVFET